MWPQIGDLEICDSTVVPVRCGVDLSGCVGRCAAGVRTGSGGSLDYGGGDGDSRVAGGGDHDGLVMVLALIVVMVCRYF